MFVKPLQFEIKNDEYQIKNFHHFQLNDWNLQNQIVRQELGKVFDESWIETRRL